LPLWDSFDGRFGSRPRSGRAIWRKRRSASRSAIDFLCPGFTESARAAGYEVETSMVTPDHVPRALAARDTRGLIRRVADRHSRLLLDAHILAPEGADSIQTAIMAIKCGMTIEEIGESIFPYRTTVEGLKLAALAFNKDVAKLSCCAG